MPTIAVAGGTGGIGRTIVEELVNQGKHEVLVLSRKAVPIPGVSVPVIAVDYNDPKTLAATLDQHKIEVVISTIVLISDDSSQSQLNLIAAASGSKTVKRFIPSEYGTHNKPELLPQYPTMKWWVDAANALRASKLEYTLVIIGFIMDYYGIPHVKSNLHSFKWILDFDNKRAIIPGDGTTKISFLFSADVAKYVVALLDLDRWPELSRFRGSTVTPKEMVEAAEKVTGTKWTVEYDSVEDIAQGKVTVFKQPKGTYENVSDEELRVLVVWFNEFAIKGMFDLSEKEVMNDKFPDIKPIRFQGLIESAWGKQ
ncbi:NAD(P)-binding protein [Aaosphaeria arxii CBS 175.79]|uniref:NAD(P)-binding protein n=1 Tax=Aaosphaeria arxii CBS 175.79 TaxID=1450172 RepID=A0A6A5XYS6_9PLEO|nr:NAD(P)-binding protein [Aaosphaeria arxii CBS 175.79]KAF2018119.1 NAD(P)-binding protein [Aaosphaeria arxii CBS 175.79]